MTRSLPGRLRLVLLVAAAACSKAAPKQGRPAVPVTVAAVRRAAVPYTVEANGMVTPFKTATVASQVEGLVKRVNFREGQDVVQGQELFEIDPRPYQATYRQATANRDRDRATAENAQREAERYAQLVKSDYVTHEQADQQRATAAAAAATVAADEAAVATAKFNLDNTVIRAPISGRTGSLFVREGNLVHAQGTTPLVVINQLSPILVRFAVPGTQLPLIQRYGANGGLQVIAIPGAAPSQTASDTASGGPASLGMPRGDSRSAADSSSPLARPSTDASGAQRIDVDPGVKGTLFFIDNAVDTSTGTVLLKASFTNEARSLWVGQFVSTTLKLFVENNALVVPSQAVVTGQQGTYVYVVNDSSAAQQRKVAVERTAGTITVIASGVREGERVVTDGQSRLTQGAKVAVNPGASGAGGAGGAGGGRGGRGRKGAGGASDASQPAAPGATPPAAATRRAGGPG